MSEDDLEKLANDYYELQLKLYKEGTLDHCPECGSERPKHKMDCGIRWEERNV